LRSCLGGIWDGLRLRDLIREYPVSVRDFQLAAGGKLARVQMPWP
jgi:hypothetical protein